jgi:hypothetical protein
MVPNDQAGREFPSHRTIRAVTDGREVNEMYYGIWVNLDEGFIFGTPVLDTAEMAEANLLSGRRTPDEEDHLAVLTDTGVLFATFDVDEQEWQAE